MELNVQYPTSSSHFDNSDMLPEDRILEHDIFSIQMNQQFGVLVIHVTI